MSDLAAASEALGIPETLVQRSAEARAAETGSSVEEILAAWAGGEKAPAGASPEETATEEPVAEEPAGVEDEEPKSDEPAPAPEVKIEIPERDGEAAAAPAAAVARAPMPAEVNAAEASSLPVVVTVPTTGIKERTNFAMPKWLATLFFVVPVFALFALGGSATGTCGEATELETNVITGELVNCDGSPFEGSAVGGGGTDFIALGEEIYQGSLMAAVNCAGCHGAGGGGGAGPALNATVNVFGQCADQVEWIALGTGGLQALGRSTYGDTNKPLGGFGAAMPGFGGSLTEEQLAAVSAFERVRFAGQTPEDALLDCGLAEEAPAEGEGEGEGEGEAPADGEAPAEGEAPGDGETATTMAGDGGEG